MGKRSINTVFGGAGFYIVLLLCVVAVGVGGYFAFFTDRTPQTEEPSAQEAAAPADDVETPMPPQVPEPVVQTVEPAPVPVEDDGPTELERLEQEDTTPVVAVPPQLIVKPVSGQTVAAFSVSELAYDETMGDWRTHDGIDIAAAAGTNVLAAAAGKVNTVYDDALMGTCVVIDHDGGYQTVYASLQSKPTVSPGDAVTAGQVIGSVGTTAAAESAQGAHLHFSVTKDGQPVDPDEFLNKK